MVNLAAIQTFHPCLISLIRELKNLERERHRGEEREGGLREVLGLPTGG